MNESPFYLQHPNLVFAVWNGGLGIFGAALGNRAQMVDRLLLAHADAVVGDGEGLGLAVDADRNLGFRPFAAVASHRRHAPLADGIHAIAHQLPQKHLMAAVNGLFDDREDVFGVDLNLALFQHRHGRR